MSRSSFPSSSTFAVVVGGVVFSLGLAGCDAGAGLRAGGSSLSAALESCEELMTEADAAAAAAETACAADSACTPESLQAQQAQIYADAQASCDALVTSNDDGDDDDDDGDDDAQGEHGNADHKITICHSTGSAHHPFVTITIDEHAIPAHDRHHDGRDIIPAPADGCPAADDDDGSDNGDHGHGHGGGGNGADGGDDDCEDNDGEDGNGPNDGPNDGGDGPNDGGDSGEGGNDAPDCTELRAEADATIADAATERDALCAFDAENACSAATADFEATQAEIEADYAAVCGAASLIAE